MTPRERPEVPMRGDGRILDRPKGSGRNWALAFYWRGIEQRESVARFLGLPPHKVTEQDAARALRQRLRDVREGRYRGAEQERLTVGDVLARYLSAKTLEGGKTARSGQLAQILARLRGLAKYRAVDLTPALVREWTQAQLTAGYARGSCNTYLGTLRAALHLAVKDQALSQAPYVPLLQGAATRMVFFTPEEAEALLAQLRGPVQDLARFGYLTGWRVSEILGLQWADVDRARGLIRLGDSKTGDGDVLPLTGDLAPLIERRWKARIVGTQIVPWVFHRKGKPIREFAVGWHAACRRAGLVGRRVFHDFRRTAARDLVEAGLDYKTAMSVTRHKTLGVFQRYQIVDSRRTAEGLERLQAFRRRANTDTHTDTRRAPSRKSRRTQA